jgi:hypothetical protein
VDLMAIREAIVTQLKTASMLDGWQVFPYIVDQFPAPAAFVCDPTGWRYDTDFDGGVEFTLTIRYAVPRADEAEAHRIISNIISTAPGSPKKAIEADPSLNGTVHSAGIARVGRMARYRTGGGDSYLGVEQEIDIAAL